MNLLYFLVFGFVFLLVWRHLRTFSQAKKWDVRNITSDSWRNEKEESFGWEEHDHEDSFGGDRPSGNTAGWYQIDGGFERYHDGTKWTGEFRSGTPGAGTPGALNFSIPEELYRGGTPPSVRWVTLTTFFIMLGTLISIPTAIISFFVLVFAGLGGEPSGNQISGVFLLVGLFSPLLVFFSGVNAIRAKTQEIRNVCAVALGFTFFGMLILLSSFAAT